MSSNHFVAVYHDNGRREFVFMLASCDLIMKGDTNKRTGRRTGQAEGEWKSKAWFSLFELLVSPSSQMFCTKPLVSCLAHHLPIKYQQLLLKYIWYIYRNAWIRKRSWFINLKFSCKCTGYYLRGTIASIWYCYDIFGHFASWTSGFFKSPSTLLINVISQVHQSNKMWFWFIT